MGDIKTTVPSDHPDSVPSRPVGRMHLIPGFTASWAKRAGVASRTPTWISALVLMVAMATFLVWQAFQITKGLDSAERALATLESLKPAENDLVHLLRDLPSLHGTLSQAQDDLQQARSSLRIALPLAPLVSWVPGIGSKVSEGKEMLRLGDSIVGGSLDLLLGLETVATVSTEPLLMEARQLNTHPLQALSASEPLLHSAIEQFETAEDIQSRLSMEDLPQDLDRLFSFSQDILPDLKGLARMGLTVSQSWGAFLGFEGPKTYLLVAQNSDELRASGGYLPGAWLLSLNRGQIERLQFWDTVNVDDLDAGLPTPPVGIVQSLWGGVWLFRDAGWYPNYPSSAQVMERLFKLGTGNSVDGVIAVNQWAVREILGAIGPVRLPEGQVVDDVSYLQVLEAGKDGVGRVFIDTVLTGLLDGLATSGSGERFAALMLAMVRSLDQSHLLPYFHDGTLQQQMLNNGWAGELIDSPSDYLMVVDSNVGWNKTDRNIEREIDYHVTLSEGGEASARLQISYANQSAAGRSDPCAIQSPPTTAILYQEMKNDCYWDYLRIYVPEASRLQNSSPFPMPAGAIYRRLGYDDVEDTLQSFPEEEKRVFSGFFTVPPERTRRVTFAYDLPTGVFRRNGAGWQYSLVVQKQPGILRTTVRITVTAPDDYIIINAAPRPSELTDEEAQFLVLLESDFTLELTLRKVR